MSDRAEETLDSIVKRAEGIRQRFEAKGVDAEARDDFLTEIHELDNRLLSLSEWLAGWPE